MVLSTDTLEVRRMGQPEWVGHRVVDIAKLGGPVAARESTGQIPTSDEPLQRGRWAVARFGGCVARLRYRRDLGAAADQLGQQRGRHRTAADNPTGGRFNPV